MKIGLTVLLTLACSLALSAQNVISTHSGVIHFVDGYGTTIQGMLVAPKLGEFPVMRDGQTLDTEESRVEVLLNPGVFLRLAEHSSIKMVGTKLSDTRVEMLTGSAVMELDELPKGNSLMLLYHDAKITPMKHGLYRLDAAQNRFRVFEGEAQVIQGDQTTQVHSGHQVELGVVLVSGRFNRKAADALDLWAAERAQLVLRANVTSANMMSRGGASSYTNSSWVWNSFYGMLTYLPARGYGYSPYGWVIYSPRTVNNYYNSYQQPSTYSATNNGDRSSYSNSSNGSVMASNPGVGAAPAPSSAPVESMSRGAVSSGGGRGR